MTEASLFSLMLPPTPPHICPAYQCVFSSMFTQEPLPNPGTAVRVLLSHSIDEERRKEIKRLAWGHTASESTAG